jgi:hypothetical protein
MNEIEITRTDVDELWIQEWAALLIGRLEATLEKHAAFEQFLRQRAGGNDD